VARKETERATSGESKKKKGWFTKRSSPDCQAPVTDTAGGESLAASANPLAGINPSKRASSIRPLFSRPYDDSEEGENPRSGKEVKDGDNVLPRLSAPSGSTMIKSEPAGTVKRNILKIFSRHHETSGKGSTPVCESGHWTVTGKFNPTFHIRLTTHLIVHSFRYSLSRGVQRQDHLHGDYRHHFTKHLLSPPQTSS
jgi:hypothetical protein